MNWSSIASSADGTKLVATAQSSGIFISTNSGITWARSGAPNENWQAVASSSDGTKLVAATYGGYGTSTEGGIYASTDSGNTWNKTGAPTFFDGRYNDVYSWQAIASSSDAAKFAAVVYGGPVFTSQNSGATWAQTFAPNAANWTSIA